MAVALLERLGDIVAASAVVALLRERYPERVIAWVGRKQYRDIALRVVGVEVSDRHRADIPADARFFGKPLEATEMIAEMKDMLGHA